MISVATVVRNEATRFARYRQEIERLARAGVVNDVVVFDQASTDGTDELIVDWTRAVRMAEGLTVSAIISKGDPLWVVGLFSHGDEHGYCELHRQRTIDATDATIPWVLVLDADERIDPECDLFALTRVADADGKGAVMFPRLNLVADMPGDRIQTYFGNDPQIRLLRKNLCSWPTNVHGRPHIGGTGVMVADGPHDQIIHDWSFYGQEAKKQRVVEAARRYEGEAAAEQMRHFHDSAIKGFKENLGVR